MTRLGCRRRSLWVARRDEPGRFQHGHVDLCEAAVRPKAVAIPHEEAILARVRLLFASRGMGQPKGMAHFMSYSPWNRLHGIGVIARVVDSRMSLKIQSHPLKVVPVHDGYAISTRTQFRRFAIKVRVDEDHPDVEP